jgi:hypothetical protein
MWPFSKRNGATTELWQWFSSNCRRFEAEEPDQEAYRQLGSLIKDIDRGLTYEIARGETWELAISADGAPELISTVQDVVSHAPKVNGWSIVAFRQPSMEPPLITAFDQELTSENVFFSIDETRDGVCDLTLYMPGIDDENYRHMAHCAMLLMESMIGELAVMTRIGEIEYESAEDLPKEAKPLSNLKHSVEC